MCMSRLHQVVSVSGGTGIVARDLEGREHMVSLLAYEGPVLKVGDWLVAQSGFALAAADAADAQAARSDLETFHHGARR